MDKKYLVVIGILLAVLGAFIVFASLTPANLKQVQSVPVTSEPVTVVETQVGNDILITLDSNITTGYEWQVTQPRSGGILQIASSDYLHGETDRLGAAGKEVWVFKALKPGRTVLSFSYVRPWEKDIAPASKKIFVVVINDKVS